jgi:hypothetical protein
MKKVLLILFVICLLSGCADQISFEEASDKKPVGFWYGLWHGTIVVIAFICSLFSDNVSIYAIYNNGGWYDFGYMIGVGAIASGCNCSKK